MQGQPRVLGVDFDFPGTRNPGTRLNIAPDSWTLVPSGLEFHYVCPLGSCSWFDWDTPKELCFRSTPRESRVLDYSLHSSVDTKLSQK
mmetsp:Transcript_6402/g.12792  ORF Transcript_6402/g.12792 Transcript_6402/m.12792 type:complete len:88 (-) Transcript_6402:41-304(-)